MKIRVLAGGIGAAVIHIVSQPVCTTAQGDDRLGLHALRRCHRTMRIRHLGAAAQFGIYVGIARGIIHDFALYTWLGATIEEEKLRCRRLLIVWIEYPGPESIT